VIILKQAGSEFLALVALAAITATLTCVIHPDPLNNNTGSAAEPLGISLDSSRLENESFLWVDARRREAFDEGHVPGAVLLNEDEWDDQLHEFVDRWQPGITVVVYCSSQSCGASRSVAVRLREELDIDSVFFLEGGWEVLQKDRL
jgi:rhodanese-related sulfurtransferase